MDQRDVIKHDGIIDSITGQTIRVKIISESACAQCHAKGACTMLDIKEKIVEVETEYPEKFTNGDKVIISMENSNGLKAVLWGYGIPFVVLLTTLIAVLQSTENELYAGLSSIAALTFYYLILFFFRDSLKTAFRFNINRL